MKVGLTYDLRDDYLAEGFSEEETAEFDQPSTINAIEGAVRQLGFETERIGHARALISRLAEGRRWDFVFNIAEGMYGFAREAQIPAILDIYQIPYTFSDPLISSLTLHKGMTQRVLSQVGIPVPDFAVVERESDIASMRMPYPLFAKPIAEGTGKGVSPTSKIHSPAELESVCRELLKKYAQPVLVEAYMPGREFTVGILGTGPEAQSVGAVEIILKSDAEAHAYSYVNKEECEDLVIYQRIEDETAILAQEIALAAWRALGCRDAGRIDLRCDAAGAPRFLEVNPLAGLHPEHSDLPIICTQHGIPYLQLIDRIMRSAMTRAHQR